MQITYNRAAFDALLAGDSGDDVVAELADQIGRLDLNNRADDRDSGLDLIYELVKALIDYNVTWTLDSRPAQEVMVYAQFPGTNEGAVHNEYIEFVVYLGGTSVGIGTLGSNSVSTFLDTGAPPTAHALLDGIAEHLTAAVRQVAGFLAPKLPLEQRIVSIDGLRDEITDNPILTDDEGEAVGVASDGQIAEALFDAWSGPSEAQFYALHDRLQDEALRNLKGMLATAEGCCAGCDCGNGCAADCPDGSACPDAATTGQPANPSVSQ